MKQNFSLFFTLYALFFVGTVFSKELLGTEQLVYNSLAEQLTYGVGYITLHCP